ncbi:DnaJ domain-containing protein [Arthrobacter sp. R3-55]
MARQRSAGRERRKRPHRISWAQASRHVTAFFSAHESDPRCRLPSDGPRFSRGPSPTPRQKPESAVSTQPDHYATLHVSPDATTREITRAYRTLLRTHHPDTRQKVDDGDATTAADLQELHAIMQAYVVLSDPSKRAAYDHSRSGTPGPRGGSSSGTEGTPVKIRVHRNETSPKPAGSAQESPLTFGPPRWEPSVRNLRSPRSHS